MAARRAPVELGNFRVPQAVPLPHIGIAPVTALAVGKSNVVAEGGCAVQQAREFAGGTAQRFGDRHADFAHRDARLVRSALDVDRRLLGRQPLLDELPDDFIDAAPLALEQRLERRGRSDQMARNRSNAPSAINPNR